MSFSAIFTFSLQYVGLVPVGLVHGAAAVPVDVGQIPGGAA